ncbi:MAG: hypothetical protein IKY11_01700 [Rikenellaceae bacterium]|nr:hypothetical protein [Rikenellaceae bacterium]
MKLIKISSCLLILALIASSCGASKRTLRKNNEALQNLLQTSIQATALQTVNSINRDTSIPAGEAKKIVSRDNPGQTALERTVIRWFIDSSPKGAQVFYRVISSVPDQVKNTNETYLMTTPYEETRSFNILGLTYENSRNVQIEIKVSKAGYYDQVKRFNVRQAIDQQEISSFFNLVKVEKSE